MDGASNWQYCRRLDEAEVEPVPEPPVLVDGLVRAGSSLLIGGASGAGKSRLAMQLGLCLLEGLPFLGRIVVDQHKVLYVQGEMGAWTAEWRAVTMARQLGVTRGRDFTLVSELGWQWKKHAPLLEELLYQVRADVLILDPFIALKPDWVLENNNDTVGQFCYRDLSGIQVRHNLQLMVVVHHFGKVGLETTGRSPIDLFRGASALGNWASAGIGLTKAGHGSAWLDLAKVREFEDVEERVALSSDGLLFKASVGTAELVAELSDGRWRSMDELMTKLGLPKSVLARLLKELGTEADKRNPDYVRLVG